jgi:acetaldehyde dehydrogenase/alcohol dehydrogenase
MAHKLGAAFHLPHGVANALLINGVIKFNATESPKKMGTFSQYKYPVAIERYSEIASFIGIDGKDHDDKVKKLMDAINDLKSKIGIKKAIQDYVPEKDFREKLDEMVEQAFDDQCTGANPRYPLMEEMKEIYLDAFYGRS